MQVQFGYSSIPRTFDTAPVHERHAWFRRETGVDVDALVFVEQVHGADTIDVYRGGGDRGIVGRADALITDVPGIALIIRTADCVPVLIVDEQKSVVAIAHAGWKGVLAGILGRLIERMEKQYGCNSADLNVMLGPSICGHDYDVSTVQDDRVARFERQFAATDGVVLRDRGAVRLDLPKACLVQCHRFGVPTQAIQLPESCTFEDARWPSHRRDGEQRQNHVWSWVCLSKPQI